MKTVTNSKDCFESRIKIFVPVFLCCHWSIFVNVHVITGFRNYFQNHRLLSEQLLESQAAAWKPEQASYRWLLESLSELVSDFREASRNFIFKFLKKAAKYCKNHRHRYKKELILILEPSKNYSSRDNIHLNGVNTNNT